MVEVPGIWISLFLILFVALVVGMAVYLARRHIGRSRKDADNEESARRRTRD